MQGEEGFLTGLARSRVVRNVAFNYLGFILQGLVGIALTPFLVSRLGDTEFGVWILLNTMLVYFQLGELGILPSVVRYVSLHEAKGDRRAVEAVVGSALSFLLVLAALTVPATWALARFGPRFFDLEGSEASFAADACWLIGATAIVSYFRRLVYGVLEGFQRFGVLNLCTVSSTLLSTPVMVLLVLRGHGMLALVAVVLGRTAYELVFELVALSRTVGIRLDPRLGTREAARTLAGFSLWAFLMDAAVSISYRIDAFLIGAFLPVAAITPYTIANRLASVLQDAIDPMVDTFFPLASGLHAERREEALSRLLIGGTRAAMILATPGLVILGWHGAEVIRWWMGPEYVAPSLGVLQVSLATAGVAVAGATAGRILLGAGQVRLAATLSVTRATAKVVLSVLLAERYGIIGVAWGTLLPSAALNLLVAIPYVCRLTGTRLGGFLVAALGHAAAIAGASLAFLWLVARWVSGPLAVFVAGAGFVLALTGLVSYRLARSR